MPIYFKSFASDFNIMFQIPMNIVKTFFINLFIAFGKFLQNGFSTICVT